MPFPCCTAPRYSLPDSGLRGAVRALSGLLSVAHDAETTTQVDDETQLIARAGGGDTAAYRQLSDRHLAKVVAYAHRLLRDGAEAEDVAQETFLRLWKHAGRWQPRAKLHTWLFRVAHNLAIDRLRKRRETGPDALERQSSGDRPSGLLARKRVAAEVEDALAALPERQRAAIALIHYQGLSHAEAAEVLECGVEAVESLLSRGRRTLRSTLSHLREHDES